MRPSGRANDELRELSFTRDYTVHAEGSVLVAFGNTKVLCTASVEEGVPRFLSKSLRFLSRFIGMRIHTSLSNPFRSTTV